MMRSGYGWLWLAGLVAGAFAVRTLLLIDATALWSDELYSVGKSFQASPTVVTRKPSLHGNDTFGNPVYSISELFK